MEFIVSNAKVYHNGSFSRADVLIRDGIVADISPRVSAEGNIDVFDFNNCFVLPGLIDVHVHLREPGFFYKETVASGCAAAAHGGFTDICSMPNLNPVPDSAENLQVQLDIIGRDATVNVHPYGALTVGEKGEVLADIDAIAADVCAFSDDGRGVQGDEMILAAMEKAKANGRLIAAHCEVNSLLEGGYIHKGDYAAAHGHKGICSESEWKMIERDLALAEKTGCAYHVCHVSAKESVELIRQAKKRGVDVTCETAPHYLIFSDADLQEDGRFKMNPPIRAAADRQALIDGILDSTVEIIATDHAPHSAEEKAKGLADSVMGVVGLETSFAAMYTHLVKAGIITLEKLVELMHVNPSERFGIGNAVEIGKPANLTVFDLDEKYTVSPDEFLTKGRATPFAGMELYGKCKLTVCNGKIVWREENV